MHTYADVEVDLSVNTIDSVPVTATIFASLFAITNPVSLYSAAITLATEDPGSGETSFQSELSNVSESGDIACIAVWLGEEYHPLLVSDTVHRWTILIRDEMRNLVPTPACSFLI